ncbi:MAG: hypothetical protein Ta2D_13670 [Rickettsiales bacterium]|nr:MAG: hypothetical protein Ta2D_13670 [Rickettsiales bacterium]
MDFREITNRVEDILNLNSELWSNDYDRYATGILNNTYNIVQESNIINRFDWRNLHLYTNVNDAMGNRRISVRFFGQEVATIQNNKISTIDKNNTRYFFNSPALNEILNTENDGINTFIEYFNKFTNYNPEYQQQHLHSEEHIIESILLKDFPNLSNNHMQPIKLFDKYFFQMPSAINTNGEYGGNGNIDILAKVDNKLCVFEIKREPHTIETIRSGALKQGAGYAVFLSHLLKSKSGKNWWKIFGFDTPIPDKLEILVCSVAPDSQMSGELFTHTIPINNADTLKLHQIYFNFDGNDKINISRQNIF